MEELALRLSPIERNVLPHLKDGLSVKQVAAAGEMPEAEAMRACQYLSNKKVLTLRPDTKEEFTLTEVGEGVVKDGLPEKRFLDALDKPKTLKQIETDAKLSQDELKASIGLLKRLGAIQMGKEITKTGDADLSFKEKVLAALSKGENTPVPDELIKRGLVEKALRTSHFITLTDIGKKLQKTDLSTAAEEKLTHDMLKTGKWKDKQFRYYDVTTPVPATGFGRKHFVNEAIAYIKQLWIEMGFTEMTGSMTQTAFWDLDTLFVPQDHPAREMQDTFYLPNSGDLPKWWEEIKLVHETGGDTGSKGWQYKYSEEEARKVLLRTHTTVLSAQFLKNLKPEDLPAKFFSVNKVFRNETLDWKHLFEFHQVEGIVVDPDLTLGDLIGLQKEFYRKMGFEKIRFRPGYFPYTEPSAEVEVFHPVKKEWVELGGMGVFRPEVVKTLLGIDVPVLAWGLGMERIITDYYDIADLRNIYDNDIERLQKAKKFVPEWD